MSQNAAGKVGLTTTSSEQKVVTIYKHVSNPDVVITVDHSTSELHGEQSQESKTFLQNLKLE